MITAVNRHFHWLLPEVRTDLRSPHFSMINQRDFLFNRSSVGLRSSAVVLKSLPHKLFVVGSPLECIDLSAGPLNAVSLALNLAATINMVLKIVRAGSSLQCFVTG
jgi:hypothetical protein